MDRFSRIEKNHLINLRLCKVIEQAGLQHLRGYVLYNFDAQKVCKKENRRELTSNGDPESW